MEGLIRGTVEAIPNRKLDDRVGEKYNYQIGTFNGQKCHIAPFYDEAGNMVPPKQRVPGKDRAVVGDSTDSLQIFRQPLSRDGAKLVDLTAGEMSAWSAARAMGRTCASMQREQDQPT